MAASARHTGLGGRSVDGCGVRVVARVRTGWNGGGWCSIADGGGGGHEQHACAGDKAKRKRP